MMDGGLLNFIVGEYLKANGSEVAKEFQEELTKAAAPLPALTPKLEMPEPEEEEADNPSLDKRSKKEKSKTKKSKKTKPAAPCKRLPVDPTFKTPVALINDVFRGSEITWHMKGQAMGYGIRVTEVTVDINGQSFSGTGRNKNDAKKNCAINALKNLLNIEDEEQKLGHKVKVEKEDETPEPEEEEADNPSPDKRSKKKTPIKRKLEIKEEVADDDNPSPEKSKKDKSKKSKKTKPAAVYVSNVSRETSVDELKEAFEKYGTITRAIKTGKRRNRGLIIFSSPEEARDAVAAMNGTNLGGRTIFCHITSPQGYVDPAVKEGRKVFIANVSKNSSYEDFKDAVEKFGEVTDFDNPGKNFAFLSFSTSEEAQACVAALNNTDTPMGILNMNIAKN